VRTQLDAINVARNVVVHLPVARVAHFVEHIGELLHRIQKHAGQVRHEGERKEKEREKERERNLGNGMQESTKRKKEKNVHTSSLRPRASVR
jgi:hypothetical protein